MKQPGLPVLRFFQRIGKPKKKLCFIGCTKPTLCVENYYSKCQSTFQVVNLQELFRVFNKVEGLLIVYPGSQCHWEKRTRIYYQ